MARRRSSSSRLRRLIAALAGVSLLLFLMPAAWSGRLIGLIQFLVPLQDASNLASDKVGSALSDAPECADPLAVEQARQQAAALAHQNAALTVRVDELEQQVQELAATRHWDAAGGRIGSQGRLIPARVVTGDILPWRESELVTTGSLQGVPRGAAVLSDAFSVAHGEEAGLQGGMAILLGEAFVGWVDKVGPHVSRVKLLSDPSVQMKVRIGRFSSDRFVPAEGYFWMVGRGHSRMEIRDVEARTVESGVVMAGDVVVSDPANARLPAALTIGKITAVISDRDNPLFAHLAVEPMVAADQLDRVFVYDPQNETVP